MEFSSILTQAREESIRRELGFIDPVCLLLALLGTTNAASPFLITLNQPKLRRLSDETLSKYKKPKNNAAPDDVPLTAIAESLLTFCKEYRKRNQTDEQNGIHLLLGILSYTNEASSILLKEGVLFEDVVAFFQENGALNPSLEQVPAAIKRGDLLEIWVEGIYGRFTPIKAHQHSHLEELYGFAHAYYLQREFGKALVELERLIAASQGHLLYEAYLMKGGAYSGLRKYEEAYEAYKQVRTVRKGAIAAYRGQGYALMLMGRYSEAIACYNVVLAHTPDNASIHDNIGLTRIWAGEVEEGIRDIEKSISLDGTDAYAYNNLGFGLFKLGRFDEALDRINYSLELDKGNAYAYKNRALVYIATSRKELACQDLILAEKYGFSERYGSEVQELREIHCAF